MTNCVEDFLDDEEVFDLRLLEERWLFVLLATDDSFFLEEEATLRDFCLVWRLPPLVWLVWLSLRSSFNEFLEEVVMTDLCIETTDGDDDRDVLTEVAGTCKGTKCLRRFSSCLPAKIYPGGSDLVSMMELEAML